MYIEIKNPNGINPRGYKDKTYVEQECALFTPGSDYPLPFKINREQGHELKPGRYALDRQSFSVDQHGNLKLGRVRLVPLAPAAAKAA